jgi:LuxR family maltose regulon positive regulatory protein
MCRSGSSGRRPTFLCQGDVAAAAHVAQAHELPLSQARVHLAQGDPTAALAVLEPFRRRMAEKAWADQELMALVVMPPSVRAAGLDRYSAVWAMPSRGWP